MEAACLIVTVLSLSVTITVAARLMDAFRRIAALEERLRALLEDSDSDEYDYAKDDDDKDLTMFD